jgi:hypothetical protein
MHVIPETGRGHKIRFIFYPQEFTLYQSYINSESCLRF